MRIVVGPVEREPHGDRVADDEVVRAGRCGVDEQIAGGERPAGARRHVQNDGLGEVLRPQAEDGLERAPDLELVAVDGVRGGDARDAGRHLRHRGAEGAGSVLARGGDDQVRADGVVDAARGRARQRRAEHGDRRDKGQPDHQGRRRLRCAPRAAHGVLPAQAARGAEQARQRAADHARHRPRHGGRQHGHPHEDQHRTEADQSDGRLRQPDGEQEHPDHRGDAAADETAAHGDVVLGLAVRHRRHRGDAHGAPGRADGRDHRHADTHHEAHDHGARFEHERARGQRHAEAAQQLLEPDGGEHPQTEADQRRHQTHDGRLAEDRTEHLAPARPHDAQQRQLPRALAHDDGEGVEDGEATDEQRDEGEDEQRRVEEAEGLADGARRLVDHGLAGHDLDAVRQDARDGALDGRLVGAGFGDDVDGRRIGPPRP